MSETNKRNMPSSRGLIRHPERIDYTTASPKEVVDDYATRKITYNRAVSLLETRSAIGALWAGEISIEEAGKYRRYEDYQPLLASAHAYFNAAEKRGLGQTLGRNCDEAGRARLYKANIFAYAGIIEGKLPNEFLARKIYHETVKIGHALSTQQMHNYESKTNTQEVTSSLIDTIAITALLQRELVNQFEVYREESGEIMEPGWFVVPSTVSYRRTNAAQPHIDNTWSIELVENPLTYGREPDPNNPIDVISKIRTGLDSSLHIPKVVDESIVRVSTYPDLRIADTRKVKIAHAILEDALDEITNPNDCLDATRRLDTRTGLLLQKLDQN
jgi:hypothetical protein